MTLQLRVQDMDWIQLGKFSTIISLHTFWALIYFSSPSWTLITQMLDPLLPSHGSQRLYCFPIYFLSVIGG